MTDWVSPVATPIAVGAGGTGSRLPSDSASSSAASSAAPRSGLVSTYSGTTSRSAPGNTSRCKTRRLRPVPGSRAPPRAASSPSTPLPGRPAPAGTGSVTSSAQLGEGLIAGEEWPQVVVVHTQCRTNRHVHVEVLICAEAPTEKHAGLSARHFPIGQQAGPVLRRIDRV